MTTTLIKNATVLTVSQDPRTDKWYMKADIRIVDDVIDAVGIAVGGAADRLIDGSGMVVMPGLVNGHNHFEQSFMSAIVRLYPGGTLDWINEFKLPLTRVMEKDDYYLSAALTALQLVRGGITTSISHICQQSVDRVVAFGVDETVRAVRDAGIRAVVPIGLAGQNEPDDCITTAEAYDSLLRDWHAQHDDGPEGFVRIWPGPTGFWSATRDMWARAQKFAAEKSLGIHTHLATFAPPEGRPKDVDQAKALGVLGPGFTGAHCAWLDDEDVHAIAAAGANVVHNPTYKLSYSVDSEVRRFGDGIAPVADLIASGCTVGIGQDGCMGDTQDLYKEMRNLAFTQHYRYRDKRLLPPSRLIEMATIGSAQTMLWAERIGSIEEGKKADIVMLDLRSAKFTPRLNILADIVYKASPEDVHTVIVNGEVLLDAGRLTRLDERAILDEAQHAAESLFGRAGLNELTRRGLSPWISDLRMGDGVLASGP